MFFAFRTHLIHWPFASNAMSCMMQQLLLCYQIPQYDRHHSPVTGILLIINAHYIEGEPRETITLHNNTTTALS